MFLILQTVLWVKAPHHPTQIRDLVISSCPSSSEPHTFLTLCWTNMQHNWIHLRATSDCRWFPVKGQLPGTQSLEWMGVVSLESPAGMSIWKEPANGPGMWTFQTKRSVPSSAEQACFRLWERLPSPILCVSNYFTPGPFFRSDHSFLPGRAYLLLQDKWVYQVLHSEQTQLGKEHGVKMAAALPRDFGDHLSGKLS